MRYGVRMLMIAGLAILSALFIVWLISPATRGFQVLFPSP